MFRKIEGDKQTGWKGRLGLIMENGAFELNFISSGKQLKISERGSDRRKCYIWDINLSLLLS